MRMCELWYRPNYPETGEKRLHPLSCILSVLGDSGKSQTDGDLMQGVEILWGLDA